MTDPTPPPASSAPDEPDHHGWAIAFAVVVALVFGAGLAAAIGHDDSPSEPKTTTVNLSQGTTVAPTVKVSTPPPVTTTVTVQAPTTTRTVQVPTETTTTP